MNTVDVYIKQPDRIVDAPFLLSIESTLVAKGRGTVVTGKVDQGRITINDELEIVGQDIKPTLCLGLEMFRKSLDYAEVGDNIGALIRGIKKDDVSRGYVLAAIGTIKPHNLFEAKAYILTKKEGGRHKGFASNYKPQFFFRTMNVTGTIGFIDNTSFVMPGDSVNLRVVLVNKVPIMMGSKFVMREGNLTIGAGVITKL
jgi:elongation factor Tu